MKFTKEVIEMIKKFIISNVSKNPDGITQHTCDYFKITKPTVLKYINELIKDNIIEKQGSNKRPNYQLVKIVYKWKYTNNNLEEDILWSKDISPLLGKLSSNVKEVCQYGFTEMVNNVIDHSDARIIIVELIIDHLSLELKVIDNGIGIFRKIKNALGLEHSKHAILELAKGKFTSDPENHSGEGIFFTSRVFDQFMIFSHKLSFVGLGNQEGTLWEDDLDVNGTGVIMKIRRDSSMRLSDIFNDYADPDKDP
ncbi:MAG: hypothetical protein KAJ62_13155, partial [Desulfobacteraceae bacterium]|nr:hypothetical protein [Desulfobacteraceae bacterium]